MGIDIDKLAAKIAKEIFEIGSEPYSPCTRIQFMAKKSDETENSQGGLCEIALEQSLRRLFKKHLHSVTS